MSRVGNNPIAIPAGVSASVSGGTVTIKGPKGELSRELAHGIEAKVEGASITVTRANDSKPQKALHGTMRSLLANMVEGVSEGYQRELEIQGVGFRAQVQGKKLVMSLGFSHPIEFDIPNGVSVEAPEATKITVAGPDKQLVGQVSARIRSYFPAEPYKGKGVRYKGEHVRRKAGKTVA